MERHSISQDEEIRHFALDGILPTTQVLAVHLRNRTLTRLEDRRPLYPLVLAEWKFTRKQMNVLLPILASYPAYAPHALLYASYRYGYARLNERRLERAYAYFAEVQAAGRLDLEIHGVRDALFRARPRLRELGLNCVNLPETGYVLDSAD